MHPNAAGPSPALRAAPGPSPNRPGTERAPPPAGAHRRPGSGAEAPPGSPLPTSASSALSPHLPSDRPEASFPHGPPDLLELEMGRLKPRRHPPPGLPFSGAGLGPGRGRDGDLRKGAPPGGGLRAGAEVDLDAGRSARGSHPTLAPLAGSGRPGPSESPLPSGPSEAGDPQLHGGSPASHTFQGLASACAPAAPGKEARALLRPRGLRRAAGFPGRQGGGRGRKSRPRRSP